VLDKSVEKGKMVIGKQGGYDLKDMDQLEFMRRDARDATASIFAAKPGRWEDTRDNSGCLAQIEL
jgi:hypothetical protein